MNILIAPDKFKDSLSASEAGKSIKKGFQAVLPSASVTVLPLADGGEGSIDLLRDKWNFNQISITVKDPLGRFIDTYYFLHEDSAYIQLSNASGLTLLSNEERNPLETSTYGTGEMIRDAITRGCKKIYLFLGGSATNDVGIGMAAALGYTFLNESNNAVQPIGSNLIHIRTINTSMVLSALEGIEFYGICDVSNKLLGPKGAAEVYGRQKGGDDHAVEVLENGVKNVADIINAQLNKDVSDIPGSGAAGGFGAGILGFLNGQLISGSSFMLDALAFDMVLKQSDLVITGEGSVDWQTTEGKVISEVLERASKHQVPVWIFAGVSSLSKKNFKGSTVQSIETIMDRAENLPDAMMNAARYLEEITKDCIATFISNKQYDWKG